MQLQVLVRVNELDVTIDHTVTLDDEYSETDLKASSRNRKTRKKKIRYENGEEVEVELSKRYCRAEIGLTNGLLQ